MPICALKHLWESSFLHWVWQYPVQSPDPAGLTCCEQSHYTERERSFKEQTSLAEGMLDDPQRSDLFPEEHTPCTWWDEIFSSRKRQQHQWLLKAPRSLFRKMVKASSSSNVLWMFWPGLQLLLHWIPASVVSSQTNKYSKFLYLSVLLSLSCSGAFKVCWNLMVQTNTS